MEAQLSSYNITSTHDKEINMSNYPSPCPILSQSTPSDIRSSTINDRYSVSFGPRDHITLTWKDLWVSVKSTSSSWSSKRHLLQNLTGIAKPCQIMAIMGPSGSGKSTLLDTLAGRLRHSTEQSGEILVNGRKQVLSYGNCAYVTQDDVLMATMTVWEAVFYSACLQLPNSMSMAEKKERAEITIREMGLQGSMHSPIGGWRARGLSGGEKRRVSIAIELLTHPRLLFLDEPTSGLDSAASFHVVKRLRHLALEGRTIIASIHQPSSDIFELFNTLCLLCRGRTIYFGPRSDAQEFFSVNGFPCPPMCNPADHYLRTINKDFEQTYDDEEDNIECHPIVRMKTEHVIDMLVKSYANSDIAHSIVDTVDSWSYLEGTPLPVSPKQATFFTQVYILTIRSFKNMYRDMGYYWLRLGIYLALSICMGTIYYNVGTGYGAIRARGALLSFVAGFLTFMAIGGFPAFVEDMRVFERERLNGHYGVAPFVVANTISSAPYLFVISAIPGAIAYFLADLHHGFNRFAYFVLTLYSTMLVVESLMMMVASIVPISFLALLRAMFMLVGGFFRFPHDIPKPFWTYPMSYIAFHTYAFEGMYKNDFRGLTFQNELPSGAQITGDSILKDVYEVKSFSKWVDLLIILGMALLYRIVFLGLIKLKEKLKHTMIKDMVSLRRLPLKTSPNLGDVDANS